MGIGVVNCIYYNPELNRYWVIDARIYQPDQDGKKKYAGLSHLHQERSIWLSPNCLLKRE